MPGTREIKRRIKSIGNTKKITRAMQMVSAVKMRKAQVAALSSRTYSELAWQIVENLSHVVDPKYHKLLEKTPDNTRTGIILITSNRGLVGGFNANLINAVNKFVGVKSNNAEVIADFISIGRKGRDAMLRAGRTLSAEFPKADRAIKVNEIRPISNLIVEEYLKGTYGRIIIAYNHFVSTVNQKPTLKQLLPLERLADGHFQEISGKETEDLPEHYRKYDYEYLFEPDPEEVLNTLLPRIIESQVYQAVLESDASENSARMVMMKNATDAASDLIDDLTLTFNKLRQANITKELAEIIAGTQK